MPPALARRLAGAPNVRRCQLAKRRLVRRRDDYGKIADAGGAVASLPGELRVMLDRDRVDRDVERIHLHSMTRPLVFRAVVRPHPKLTCGHADKARDMVLPHPSG